MPKQIPLKINTTFLSTKPAGLGAQYLNSGEIDTRAGIEIAIGCLFAPLGAAVSGASRKQVSALIAVSRTQLEIYFSLALSRCGEVPMFLDKTGQPSKQTSCGADGYPSIQGMEMATKNGSQSAQKNEGNPKTTQTIHNADRYPQKGCPHFSSFSLGEGLNHTDAPYTPKDSSKEPSPFFKLDLPRPVLSGDSLGDAGNAHCSTTFSKTSIAVNPVAAFDPEENIDFESEELTYE